MSAAVVTGAAGGLGLAIATALHARGYDVLLADVDHANAADAAQRLGGHASACSLDVTDAEACRRVAARAAARSGGLEVWVNNAGLLRTGYAWDADEAARRALLDVNVAGTLNGTIAALEHMRPSNQGHIINIVSLAGIVAAPGETIYSATKHACLAFSVGTLLDLRRAGIDGVHVSALCPDGIWTPMLYDKLDDPECAMSFAGTLLDPDVVATRAVALLDHPRPVTAVPRRRGAVARLVAQTPRLVVRLQPLIFAGARRKQRRHARRLASGSLGLS